MRVRYKQPDSDTSTRMDVPLVDRGGNFARATTDFRFAASVAEFGMILRNSPYKGTSRMDTVLDIVEGSLGSGSQWLSEGVPLAGSESAQPREVAAKQEI